MIEGVMMLGRHYVAVAVREPAGTIAVRLDLLPQGALRRLRAVPLLRGVATLGMHFALGIRALVYSSNVSQEDEYEVPKGMLWGTLALAFVLGVAFFFLAPVLIADLFRPVVPSALGRNLIEGAIRLAFLLAYLIAMGRAPDIARVFAYHGAEHKTINALEHGRSLEIDSVQQCSTAHGRCGTGFLLVVVVVSIAAFAALGDMPLWLRLVSRVLLLPVIAGASYELIRLTTGHERSLLGRALQAPILALQALTTREPSDDQVEVALRALDAVRTADERYHGAAAPAFVHAG